MKKLLFILLLFISVHGGFAFNQDTAHEKKVNIIPVPVFYYAPETRFAFGAGASLTFKLSNAANTNYSQILGIAAFTQNHQAFIDFPIFLYSNNNDYYVDGEIGMFKYSYYYWGIGDAPVHKELYEVRYPRISIDAYRRVFKKLYAGLDYNFVRDNILRTDSSGVLRKGEVTGCRGYIMSGAGITLLYDSRDSIFFPTKGLLIKIATYFNQKFFGSNHSFDKYSTDVSWYKSLSHWFILAVDQRNILTFGDVPFDQLALVGGSKQMRGYYYGYYRDKFMTLLQAEARIHLYRRWGFDAFGGSALIGNPNMFPDPHGPIFAEGMGLRYNANKKQHINIRGDVGYGNSFEYYLSVEEAF